MRHATSLVLQLPSIESRENSGLAQLLIGRQENPALRRVLAPLQGSSQLEGVRSTQVVAIYELGCLGSQSLRRLDNKPRVRQRCGQLASPCPVAGIELFHAPQPSQGACNLNWSRPPDDCFVSLVKSDRARRRALTDTQWDQGARVPER